MRSPPAKEGRVTAYEKETIINYNEGESTASVYTHNKALRRTLDKLAQERPEDCRVDRVSHEGAAIDYTIPKAWVHSRGGNIRHKPQKRQGARGRCWAGCAGPVEAAA